MGRVPRWLRDRLGVWAQVFKQGGRAVLALLLGEIVTLLLLVRDNVLSPSARDALQFANFIPRLSSGQWLAVGVVLVFLFAMEGAYRFVRQEGRTSATEIERLNTEVRRLQAEKTNPDLLGEIVQIMGGEEPGPPPATHLLMTMTVLNRGTPSVAKNYRAGATVGGEKREVELWYMPDKLPLTARDGTQLQASQADSIQEKTMTRIETGAQISGLLYLRIPGISRQAFFHPGNTIEVSFEDMRGKRYVATQELQDGNQELVYYPGGPRPVGPQPGT